MFVGKDFHSVDDKGRIFMPAKYRDKLEGEVVISYGLDGCLHAYSLTAWEETVANIESVKMDIAAKRDFMRYFVGEASFQTLDKQGRVLIPLTHREKAGIKDDVIILGVGKKMEIWAKEIYENKNLPANFSPELIVSQFPDLDI